MDVLLYNSAPYHHVQLHVIAKRTSSSVIQLSANRRRQVLRSFSSCNCRFISTSFSKNRFVRNDYQSEASKLLDTNRNLLAAPPRAFDESYSGPVVREGEGLEDISVNGKSVPKVMIPGLPDESKGESRASISGCYWEWKPKLSVYYEKAGCENVNSPPLLFLPGFGVGSFHYKKQLEDLGRHFRVYALDFLGQGKSLPFEDPAPWPSEVNISGQLDQTWGFGDKPEPWAEDLVYSIDLWTEQVQYFIEQVT